MVFGCIVKVPLPVDNGRSSTTVATPKPAALHEAAGASETEYLSTSATELGVVSGGLRETDTGAVTAGRVRNAIGA
ncbi:hypothetical protein I0Q12_01810 [Rhodococcus sp. CX]|uniref:hypothetical protein n=1 Tax=Rhodococcus sp. CX TaxID=2789880 RepID=UPI0018CD445E|nr:hypothetical protein [Rhodococcus sp. CX]MBH0118338.1 hypothetical protein [Rhodococcus sp. CX]